MGPTVSVLLLEEIGWGQVPYIDSFLANICKGKVQSSKSTRDFCIEPQKFPIPNRAQSECQFSMQFDNKLREIDEDELVEISLALNFEPKSKIIFSAGCNQGSDHYILGVLCLEIARLFGGLIDFGGNLNKINPGISAKLKGRFHIVEYNGGNASYLLADVEFMENYLKYPNFRMIK